VTRACNLRCSYCYFSASAALPDEMSAVEFAWRASTSPRSHRQTPASPDLRPTRVWARSTPAWVDVRPNRLAKRGVSQ